MRNLLNCIYAAMVPPDLTHAVMEDADVGPGSAENVVWEAKCLIGIATNLRIPSSRGRIVEFVEFS